MEHVAKWFGPIFLIEEVKGLNLILLKMEKYFGKPQIRSVRLLLKLSHWRIETEPRTVGRVGCPKPKSLLGSARLDIDSDRLDSAEMVENASSRI